MAAGPRSDLLQGKANQRGDWCNSEGADLAGDELAPSSPLSCPAAALLWLSESLVI